MKRLPVAALVLCFLTFRPWTIRAQDPASDGAALPPALGQLFADLATIPAGSTVADTQHQALVADLDALAVGVFTPDPADVDQLATDLGTAATAGLFSGDVLQSLAADFITDSSDPTDDPDGWMDDIQDDVASLIDPPDDTVDPGDAPVFYAPLDGAISLLAVSPAGKSATRMSAQLAAQGIQPPLLENYTGQVQLATQTVAGGATVDTLRLRTEGLPLVNPYTVSITRRSDGVSVLVGKLHVHNGFAGFLAVPASLGASPRAEVLSYGRAVFGGNDAKRALPAGFDPADVASVTVTDAQGIVRLTGSIDDGATSTETQTLHLHLSGPAVASAPAPYANVAVRHKVTPAGTADRFRLLAHHLPANASVTLWADGVKVDQYTTTAHGRLFVIEGFEPTALDRHGVSPSFNSLRPGTDLSDARMFTLTDAQGGTLVGGSLN